MVWTWQAMSRRVKQGIRPATREQRLTSITRCRWPSVCCGQGKKSACVSGRQPGQRFDRLVACRRQGLEYIGQVGRLVAPGFGPWSNRAGRQIRTIGFDHQAVVGDASNTVEQVLTAALVANPAGDADVQIQR